MKDGAEFFSKSHFGFAIFMFEYLIRWCPGGKWSLILSKHGPDINPTFLLFSPRQVTIQYAHADLTRSAWAYCIYYEEQINLIPRAHVPSGQHQETELWDNPFENPVGFAALLIRSRHIIAEWLDIFVHEIKKLQIKWLKECQQRLQMTLKLKSVGPVAKLQII